VGRRPIQVITSPNDLGMFCERFVLIPNVSLLRTSSAKVKAKVIKASTRLLLCFLEEYCTALLHKLTVISDSLKSYTVLIHNFSSVCESIFSSVTLNRLT